MKTEQVPRVLSWGSAPFSVTFRSSKPVVYSHNLELEVTLSEDLVFIETLRIIDGVTEHKFTCEDVAGDWRSVRVQAFQDCVAKAGKTLPLKRLIIFGASHALIQQGILERFPEALDSIRPVNDAEAEAVAASMRPRRANGKTVSWGDDKEVVVDGPCEGHQYGGWGLEAFFTIPNREQLREMNKSVAERQVESDDLDEYMFDEDTCVDDFVENHFSIFNDDQEEDEVNLDDDKTIFPADEVSGDMEGEDEQEVQAEESEDETDPDSPDAAPLDQPMVSQSDSDEEASPLEREVPCRKRVKLEPQNESNKVFCEDVEANERSSTSQKTSSANSCRPAEDELRESDFWLLETFA